MNNTDKNKQTNKQTLEIHESSNVQIIKLWSSSFIHIWSQSFGIHTHFSLEMLTVMKLRLFDDHRILIDQR